MVWHIDNSGVMIALLRCLPMIILLDMVVMWNTKNPDDHQNQVCLLLEKCQVGINHITKAECNETEGV